MHASEFARKRAKIERRAGNRAAFLRKAMGHLVRDAGAVVIHVRGQVVGWRMRGGSVVCVKRRYRDELVALIDLETIRRTTTKRSHIPLRAYHCVHCSGFHLTSQNAKNI